MAITDNNVKWKVKKVAGTTFGSDGYWQPNEQVKVGTIRFPQGSDNIGYILECIEAGTTGEEQPTLIGEELANYAEVGRVGQVRVIFNLAEKDVDEVMAMGITYSRLTYPELWEWAGKRAGLIISEEEWQAKFAETNGKFVPYYSSGDGSSTFRTPLLGAYLKGAETASEVGKWLDAGLPDIVGIAWGSNVNTAGAFLNEKTGAFFSQPGALAATIPQFSETTNDPDATLGFKASLSNPIYGNSNTVTPETMTGIWVIKAVGVVVDSGETDIAQVLTATEQAQERVSVVEDWTQDSANFSSMPGSVPLDLNTDRLTEIEGMYYFYYTAPCDGWFGAEFVPITSTYRVIAGIRNTEAKVWNFLSIDNCHSWEGFVPLRKGQLGELRHTIQDCKIRRAYFTYAQSEV